MAEEIRKSYLCEPQINSAILAKQNIPMHVAGTDVSSETVRQKARTTACFVVEISIPYR